MERTVHAAKSLQLSVRETERWQIFTFQGDTVPTSEDLIAVLEGLKREAECSTKPIALDVAAVVRPNSRMLSAVIGQLTGKNDLPRRVALIGPNRVWLDMLDILGVRPAFLVVDRVEEITFED